MTDTMTREELIEEVDRLNRIIERALSRFDREDSANNHAGHVRGEVAWAMADDLRDATRGPKKQRTEGTT